MGIRSGTVRRGDGRSPAVVLVDPKFPHNVGAAVRAASCYGLGQVWFTGDRSAHSHGHIPSAAGGSP